MSFLIFGKSILLCCQCERDIVKLFRVKWAGRNARRRSLNYQRKRISTQPFSLNICLLFYHFLQGNSLLFPTLCFSYQNKGIITTHMGAT